MLVGIKKIDEAKITKEQKEILKAQEKIKKEQEKIFECQGDNVSTWKDYGVIQSRNWTSI